MAGDKKLSAKMELGEGFNVVMDGDATAIKDLNEQILFDREVREDFCRDPQKFLKRAGIEIDRRLIPDEATLRSRIEKNVESLTTTDEVALVCGAVCVGPPVAPVGCVAAVI